jgi:hypothetical protein
MDTQQTVKKWRIVITVLAMLLIGSIKKCHETSSNKFLMA